MVSDGDDGQRLLETSLDMGDRICHSPIRRASWRTALPLGLVLSLSVYKSKLASLDRKKKDDLSCVASDF